MLLPFSRRGPLAIGALALPGPVILAPMSGITDAPFRRCVERLGAALVVSEMTAGADLARRSPDALLRAEGRGLGLHVVQLAGCAARWMAEGARIAEASGAHAIDINMGCPARQVTGGQSGAALMRDLDHALALIEATVGAVSVPVTLKMRLGWDERSINAPELARRAEGAGVRLIAVHARTRCQFYRGRADWKAVRAVSDSVSVPVVVTGIAGAVVVRVSLRGIEVPRAAILGVDDAIAVEVGQPVVDAVAVEVGGADSHRREAVQDRAHVAGREAGAAVRDVAPGLLGEGVAQVHEVGPDGQRRGEGVVGEPLRLRSRHGRDAQPRAEAPLGDQVGGLVRNAASPPEGDVVRLPARRRVGEGARRDRGDAQAAREAARLLARQEPVVLPVQPVPVREGAEDVPEALFDLVTAAT